MYILMPDIPEQGNWRNSEIATIFAELYSPEEIVVEATVEEGPSISEDQELKNYLWAKAERELGVIKEDLQKLATKSALDGNHRAALLIENTINELVVGGTFDDN